MVYDEAELPHSIFTGDTLFSGDVGRPDLLSGNLSAQILAGKLYHSLQDKIKKLPDHIIVYPGHGPGSACGKNIGKETVTTIGEQKKTNYALQDMPEETFIPLIVEGQAPPPQYFFTDAKMNQVGYESFEDVMNNNLYFISPLELERNKKAGTIILDTRAPEIFVKGFIPGSVNIGLDGNFAIWVGTLFPFKTEFILVTEDGKEKETIARLARIGYENVVGVLEGGISSWIKSGRTQDKISSLNPDEFEKALRSGKFTILDVRRPAELEQNHILSAVNSPLSEIYYRLGNFDSSVPYIICCAGGYRSVIAASILKAAGIQNIYNVSGGVARLKREKPGLIKEFVS